MSGQLFQTLRRSSLLDGGNVAYLESLYESWLQDRESIAPHWRDYFDGLPADCPVTDDLTVPVGDAADPNVAAALAYLATGACPPAPAMRLQADEGTERRLRPEDRRGPAWREFAGAY